jgi:hypothetical protein
MLKKAPTTICIMLVISIIASLNVFAINETTIDDTRIPDEDKSLITNVNQGLKKLLIRS